MKGKKGMGLEMEGREGTAMKGWSFSIWRANEQEREM